MRAAFCGPRLDNHRARRLASLAHSPSVFGHGNHLRCHVPSSATDMLADRATLYRTLLRELRLSIEPPRRVNRTIISHFRSIAEQLGSHDTPRARQDFENAILFLKSQREHKRLLERYNPLFDLTAQERIEATARRVGLNMPKTPEA